MNLAERFQNHRVWTEASTLVARVADLPTEEDDPPDLVESLERLRHGAKYIERTLRGCDPVLAPNNELDTVADQIRLIINGVDAFVSDSNPQHLVTANTHQDNTVSVLSRVRTTWDPPAVDGLSESILSFRRSASQHLRYLGEEAEKLRLNVEDVEKKAAETLKVVEAGAASTANRVQTETTAALEAIKTELGAARTEIQTQKARLDQAIAAFQSQFSSSEAERASTFSQSEATRQKDAAAAEELRRSQQATALAEHTAALEGVRAKADAAIAKIQNDASSMMGTLKKDVATLEEQARAQEKERQSSFEQSMATAKTEREGLAKELAESAQRTIEQIETEKSKAIELVHVIGNTGMTGAYQKLANSERIRALVWHGVAVVAMVALIVVAALLTFSQELTWAALAGKIFIATACGILAAYAAREASGHQRVERRARRTELEMASIDPYIQLLPEATKSKIKEDLAYKMFGQAEVREPEEKPFNGNATDVAKLTAEITKGLVDGLGKK